MAELYDFQQDAVKQLVNGKHIIISGVGSGKTAMAVVWAEKKIKQTGKSKLLIVTTASKSRTNDFQDDIDKWCSLSFRETLSSLSILSWHKLSAWVQENFSELDEWVVIFDEIQRAKAGISSGMGRAYLKLTKRTDDWAGFTATPSDTWLGFYPFFVACGLEKNKTSFMNKYAIVQTFKGYPEIVGWQREKDLKLMWEHISYAPDTSVVMSQLPSETHKVIEFKKPASYNKVLKTRMNEEGEFLDTAGGLCAELRRQCFTKDKQQWLADFVDGLGTGAVVFYNFIKTGDMLENIISKALPKGAKVWRIDGKHHEIPTADTIGKYDIVLCQWQSGSEALNLQFLHYWVSVEPHYAYSTSVQARGRIKRIGQKNNMFYYYLVCDNGIEQDIMKCLKNKSTFAEDVWCADNNLIEKEN